jgi:hypothetical protein
MNSHQSPKLILILLPVLGLLHGCSPGPTRVAQLYLDSSKVSSDAIKQHDKDGDGKLNKDELKAIPAIANTIAQYDTDNDSQINAAEIAARIDKWQAMKVAFVSCSFVVNLDGKPLADAQVRLEPEAFLASVLATCQGTTDARGRVSPSQVSPTNDANSGLTGVPPGLYKLIVMHPKLDKLSHYNTSSSLGLQVAPDDPSLMMLEFNLASQ